MSPKKEGSKGKERKELSKVRNVLARLVLGRLGAESEGRAVYSTKGGGGLSPVSAVVWLPLVTPVNPRYTQRLCQTWI